MQLALAIQRAAFSLHRVALQTVVDQTQALHTLKSHGVPIDYADLAFLSPYPASLKPEVIPVTTALLV